MKNRLSMVGLWLAVCCLLCAGCAAKAPNAAAFLSQGFLKDECVAQTEDGARYAFLAPEGEPNAPRSYLYELDENGGRKRIVCSRADCKHEQQGTLFAPCNAYALATQGLMSDGQALYAASKNGQIGICRFDPKGGAPETLVTASGAISCFTVADGTLYYAQQDQSFGQGTASSADGGYRLCKRSLSAPDAEAETVYQRVGAVGYIACVQVEGDRLILTEVRHSDGDALDARMDVLCVGADGSAEVLCENAGGHNVARLGDGYAVARQNQDGTWSAVLLDEKGAERAVLQSGEAPCMVLGVAEYLLVDSGKSIPAVARTLTVYDGAGKALGMRDIPENYGYLLGADAESAYYWADDELVSVPLK